MILETETIRSKDLAKKRSSKKGRGFAHKRLSATKTNNAEFLFFQVIAIHRITKADNVGK